jgi:hypothetical protein
MATGAERDGERRPLSVPVDHHLEQDVPYTVLVPLYISANNPTY